MPNENTSDFVVNNYYDMNSGAIYFIVAIEFVFILLSSSLANLGRKKTDGKLLDMISNKCLKI